MQKAKYAAAAAWASLLLLIPAYGLPFAELSVFGEKRVYTLWASMAKLAAGGSFFLAAMIFVFSVAFPLAKLGVLLAGLGGRIIAPEPAARLLGAVKHLGKWSMTDVFIVAFVLWLANQGGFATGSVRAGIFFFAASTIFSMAATALAPLPGTGGSRRPPFTGTSMQADDYQSELSKAPQGAPPMKGGQLSDAGMRRTGILLISLALLSLAVAGAVIALSRGPAITRIDIAKKGGFLDIPPILDRVRDYYLIISIEEPDGRPGELITPAYEDVPIGNGLSFDIDGLLLSRIREITIMDKNRLLADTPLDRVRVRGKELEGQSYTFRLDGPSENGKWLAAALAALGFLCLGLGAVLLLGARKGRPGPAA